MEYFPFKTIDLYVSSVIVADNIANSGNSFNPEVYLDHYITWMFNQRKLFKEYLQLYSQLRGIEKQALLIAHGESNPKWTYSDPEPKNLQNWISRKEKNYGAILLCVCNPGNHTPKSKQAALYFADGNVGFSLKTDRRIDETTFNLFVPNKEIIDSYTIDSELEELKKRLGQK